MRNLTHTFTLDGTEFQAQALPPDKSLNLLGVITGEIIPAAIDATGADLSNLTPEQEASIFSRIASAASKVPEVYRTVLQHSSSKVRWNGGWVDLPAFERDVFARRPTLILAWLSECLRFEFSDFLSESGQNLIREAVSNWTSQTQSESPGQSGGS
jgi:hypothetical protein